MANPPKKIGGNGTKVLNLQENDKSKNKEIVNVIQVNDENFKGVNSKDQFNVKNKSENIYDNNNNTCFKKFLNQANEININKTIKYNDELLNLKEFKDKYPNFKSIYLADLKKHHILYFSFCCDNNNIFLKLSFFSLTLSFFFGLNTFLIFDSKMSDAYYDTTNTKPIYILMNLLLPFIICGLISFVIKILIMPQYLFNKMVKKIQSNDVLKNMLSKNKKDEKNRKEPNKNHRRNLSNKQSQNNIQKNPLYNEEKKKLEKELALFYTSYLKKVIIYYIISFLVLGFIWYMMTSFCAIFRNTGIKLILNSFISLFASFILPFILGLIPTGVGFLATKINNEVIYKIYNIINVII